MSAARTATKAAKSAEHTLYHVAPQGFWKKFRDAIVVNPEISSGLPIVTLHRNPQPGSRPELYATPATKASDPAQNPYWKRDVRRAYPRRSVITQAQLSQFLLQSPDVQGLSSLASPESKLVENTADSTAVTATSTSSDLSKALELLATAGKTIYSDTSSIPTPASIHPKWVPQYTEDAPHDPHAYWPMKLVK
ncbi:NADH dehydrogenase 21 kDa subunit [Hysterangium stoloniferum]|nr:NADH dehydrogenase 21 kDa subunit [Hysterangium stoloniferum]